MRTSPKCCGAWTRYRASRRAGMSDAIPLGHNRSWGIGVKGVQYKPNEYPEGFPRIISEGYFHAIGVPLKEGRDFSARDDKGTLNVIILNETCAQNLFPNEDPIGKIITEDVDRTVVGVVGDVHHMSLEEGSGNEFYIPLRQIERLGIGRSCGAIVAVDVGARVAIARGAAAARAESADVEHADDAVDGGPSGVAAAIRGDFAGRICGVRAGAGFAGDLCGDFVFGEPADAGDRDSHGAGRVVGDAAEEHLDADVVAGGDWRRWRNYRLVDFGAGVERDAVWSDADGSGHVCGAWS